ncbi:TetR/AcrR family transcriptional regulator [Streptacidiphilus rugosus]|uniref:TetR/AcrR family transcriptional regulator n=1 Tax=Streptacidiphilus rugosus TaxID=405783 RepID=UPI00069000B1|nr:helix-turn-helix domain-containing protein [Streptacidiphilus rugosus]
MDPVETGPERVERVRPAPEQRRQALIETALAKFAATPYAAVSVDELAREAGMSRPLLYHYFGSKLGVFLAALEHAADLGPPRYDRCDADVPTCGVRRRTTRADWARTVGQGLGCTHVLHHNARPAAPR